MKQRTTVTLTCLGANNAWCCLSALLCAMVTKCTNFVVRVHLQCKLEALIIPLCVKNATGEFFKKYIWFDLIFDFWLLIFDLILDWNDFFFKIHYKITFIFCGFFYLHLFLFVNVFFCQIKRTSICSPCCSWWNCFGSLHWLCCWSEVFSRRRTVWFFQEY